MEVLLKKPGAEYEKINIENNHKAFQEQVLGYFEEIHFDKNIIMLINEDAIYRNLSPNINYKGTKILGPVLFVSDTEDGLEYDSLSEKQIQYIEKYLKKNSL